MSPTMKLVLVAVFAVAGWQHARHLTRKYGRAPFGWPDWLWGVVTGVSLFIGIVLLAVAERRLRKAPAIASPSQSMPGVGVGMSMLPTTAAFARPTAYHERAEPVATVSPIIVAENATTTASACWAADPYGRHQYRWWDGAAWTGAVHSNGVTTADQYP